MNLSLILNKLKNNRIIKDSFWAIMGNGIGNLLLLIAGIVIARLLGKDLYGEYGLVKTNMFYMAGFATFGLVFSSTRFVAKFIKEDPSQIIDVVISSTKITFTFSSIMALTLCVASKPLEHFLNTPGLAPIFRTLAIVIVLKALASTGNGILAGLGQFEKLAKSTVLSGICMFSACIPLTYFWGLYGALTSLALSQLINLVINYYFIIKQCKLFDRSRSPFQTKKLLKFSFPIALQEISFAVCNWAGIMLLTKLSSVSEVGLYSATAQWNAVITMIPGMLANVVLSHLSGSDEDKQKKLVSKILAVYFICTLIPFIVVYIFSNVIVGFYGAQFAAMKTVLRLNIFITIPTCCSDVFKAELISLGKTWMLFSVRTLKDILLVIFAWLLLSLHKGIDGAYYYSMSLLIASIVFLIIIYIMYRIAIRGNAIVQ